MMCDISAAFGSAQTERVDAQKTFTASESAVATTYALNPKSGALLTLHNINKMPRLSAGT